MPLILMFQKRSPYLEDVNLLINLAKQMGLIDNSMKTNVPNSTKCTTYQDIQESHSNSDKPAVLKFEDLQGTLIMWVVGVGVASFVIMVEAVISLRTTYKILDIVYFGAMESAITESVATYSVRTESVTMESALTDICQTCNLSDSEVGSEETELAQTHSVQTHSVQIHSVHTHSVQTHSVQTHSVQTHSVQAHVGNGVLS